MKRIALVVAVLLSRSLAAQDSTQAPTPPAAPAPAPAAPAAAPTASAATVSEAVVAKTVTDRVPQDTGTTFPADVGQVACWTKVSGASGTTIHHVWFHGDTQVGDVELQVGGSPWRTWSRKTVPPDWTGAWHVEVRDQEGKVLKRLDFTVGQ